MKNSSLILFVSATFAVLGDNANVVTKARLGALSMKTSMVVTNVTFDGLLSVSYTNEYRVVLGKNANATCDGSTALGYAANATCDGSIALGTFAEASGDCSIALGFAANARNANSVVINATGTDHYSQGVGTVTLGVKNGLADVYVGETSLADAVSETVSGKADASDLAATTQRVAQVESNVSSMWYTLYGESCWLAVTNYMRSVEGVMPSFSLWEVRDGATNEVYSSRDEVTNRVAAALAPVMDDVADAAAAAESAKAWGRFQSADGTPAPAKFTMVTTPYLMMTGGGEWEQHVVSGGGEYWVFTGAGGVGGTEDGNFRLLDSNGATAMEVTAGSVQTVGAVPASFSVSDGGGGTKSVSFAVFATSAPTLYAAESPAGPWSEQAATWTAGAAGTYSCAFSVPSAYDRMFFKAAYEAGSAPCVKFAKPLEVTQLKIGGTVYDVSTKTDSDGSILLKLTVPTSTGGN